MAWDDAIRRQWFGNPFAEGAKDWDPQLYKNYFAGKPNTIAWMDNSDEADRLAICKALFRAAEWIPNAVHRVRDDTKAIVIETSPTTSDNQNINWQNGNKMVICCGAAISKDENVTQEEPADAIYYGLSLPDQDNSGLLGRLKKIRGETVNNLSLRFYPIQNLLNAQAIDDLATRIQTINPRVDAAHGNPGRLVPSLGQHAANPHQDAVNQQATMQLNTILYGPPGTGKTLATLGLALSLFNLEDEAPGVGVFASRTIREEYEPPPAGNWAKWVANYDRLVTEGRIAFTTFHQNYAYEDFVEGLGAEAHREGENGPTSVKYSVKDGIFKRMAYRALHAWLTGQPLPIGQENNDNAFVTVKNYLERGQFPDLAQTAVGNAPPYLLIIDEINRGNMARILGELITLLEDSKRARRQAALGQQPLKAILPYSRTPFIVPPNLYILGTMNTADRSLIGLDVALRRRFSFIELPPRPEALQENVERVQLQAFFKEINRRIANILDSDHRIGHAFFTGVTNVQELGDAMRQKVIPQLREYFHDRPQDLFEVLKTAVGNDCSFLRFEGAGRNLRVTGIRTENLYNADSYNSLLPGVQAAQPANQGA